MSSSKISKLSPHVVSLIISIVVATSMWYAVSVRDRIEAQFEINIDYYNIPKGLMVTDGLINKITVRLRGPETLLRSISNLNQQVDLSRIKKGVTIVPLSSEQLSGHYRAFEIVDVQPPRIVVRADTVAERSVPVKPVINSPLRSGALTVENIMVEPAVVTLRGPEGTVSDISSLRLPIVIDPKAAGTTISQNLPLDTPSLVTVTPSTVRISYTITSGRSIITRRYPITISSNMPSQYRVEPAAVELRVEVPEALSKSGSYLSSAKLNVIPPNLKPGESAQVNIHYRIPDGMSIMPPMPEKVTITMKEQSKPLVIETDSQ